MEQRTLPKYKSYVAAKNEDYMNEQQLTHFKKILVLWEQNINENNLVAKVQLQEDTSPLADMSDRATLEEEFALSLRTRDRERKLVSKINAALERIANEEFGYCESCGDEIGILRLEARPTAELCIDCKELAEKKEIRIRDHR